MNKRTWATFFLVGMSLTTFASGNALPTSALPTTPTVSTPLVSWNEVVATTERKRKPLGSRGGICALAPGQRVSLADLKKGKVEKVWTLQPTFIWRGAATQVTFQGATLWQAKHPAPPAAAIFHTQYTGTALQPGQLYEWSALSQTADPLNLKFRVLDTAERSEISQQLKTLEATLKAKGATPEQLALQRAGFFADRELWSDALSEMLSVKNPSPELQAAIEQLPNQLCNQSHRSPGAS